MNHDFSHTVTARRGFDRSVAVVDREPIAMVRLLWSPVTLQLAGSGGSNGYLEI